MFDLFRAHDGGIRTEQEVDARVGHEVDLKLIDVDVQGALEAQRNRQRGNHLRNQTVEVLVCGLLHSQLVLADVVDGFVVEHECHVSVFQQSVGR